MIELWNASLRKIEEALGGQIRLVGGCVRDFLLGKKPDDIDIVTPLVPGVVMDSLKKNRIRARLLAPRHGVVLAVVHGEKFEITTLRRDDYSADGREKITFITDYREDARRRDFTINALYMDRDGRIYDYVDGQADLKNHIVRFIGEPATRLREDPLRFLRYIRFWSLFGGKEPDTAVLACFPTIRDKMAQVSYNRLQKEIKKLARLPRRAEVRKLLVQIGLEPFLSQIGTAGQTFFNTVNQEGEN